MKQIRTYLSRNHAGEILAQKVLEQNFQKPLLLAIPRGGIEIAENISKVLNIPINPIITKKLPMPNSPETGFGAITDDGSVILNEEYFKYLALSTEEFDEIKQKVISEIKHRIETYGSYDKNLIKGSDVLVVDDGAATGYSIIAALKSVKNYNPASITAILPVSSIYAYEKIVQYCDQIICPIVEESPFFAVANYYREWHDLSADKIIKIINNSKK